MFARSAAASSSRPAEGRNTHNRKKPAKSKTNTSGNRNSNESHGSRDTRSKTIRRTDTAETSVDRIQSNERSHSTIYQHDRDCINL